LGFVSIAMYDAVVTDDRGWLRAVRGAATRPRQRLP
jgi:hypothetical protein